MTETHDAGDPMELLRRRLAAGEITAEEFDRIRERLVGEAAEPATSPPLAQSTASQPATEEERQRRTVGASSSFFIRFLSGRLPLSTSFIIFAAVFAVLIANPGTIGGWWSRIAVATGLPLMLHVHVMALIGLLAIVGTGWAAWRRMGAWDSTGVWALLVFLIVIFFGSAFLHGYISIL